MRHALRWLVFVGAALLLPSSAGAQACGPQSNCLGTYSHKVLCPAGFGVRNCHSDCGDCLYGNCHPTCGYTVAPGVSGDADRRYVTLLELADRADVEGLIGAAALLPQKIFYNAERDAVQLVACDGVSIAASIPISSAAVRLLAQAVLPDVKHIDIFGSSSWRAVARLTARRVDALR